MGSGRLSVVRRGGAGVDVVGKGRVEVVRFRMRMCLFMPCYCSSDRFSVKVKVIRTEITSSPFYSPIQ